MKKVISFILVLSLILSAACISFAEGADDEEVNEQDILSAEELTAAMSSKDENEAFLQWAKACTAVILVMKDSAYNCATGTYEYAVGNSSKNYTEYPKNIDVIKAMMKADDMWQVTVPIPRNGSSSGKYTDLNNSVIGYKNLVSYDALLTVSLAQKPSVPSQYEYIAGQIDTAASKIHSCVEAVNKWLEGSGSAMDLWGDMESLYWHTSILNLSGIYYIDSRLND